MALPMNMSTPRTEELYKVVHNADGKLSKFEQPNEKDLTLIGAWVTAYNHAEFNLRRILQELNERKLIPAENAKKGSGSSAISA
jgi:hypothetical protein